MVYSSDNSHDRRNSSQAPKPSLIRFVSTNARKSDGILSILIIVGFIIVIGINFMRSLSNQHTKRDHIISRQVELLRQLKNEVDEKYIQFILTEYDSLSNLLDDLDAQNNKTQPQ